MPRYEFTKEELFELYWTKKLNPYEIASHYGCNHKTIRAHLRRHQIELRSASEYNYLSRPTHIKPTFEALYTNKSVAAHVAYLCEGWHTSSSTSFYFCNQDPALIDLILWLLNDLYRYHKSPRLVIATPIPERANSFLELYPTAGIQVDKERKNPILKIHAGGKHLVRDVVQNAYSLLQSLA